MNDNDYKVIEAMEKYGGSFVQALAVAYRRADPTNYAKLRATFGEYWFQYEAMVKDEEAQKPKPFYQDEQ